MKVSVVIPVYNAEAFIEKAVVSALKQKQTQEIVLIEDGSNDNSLYKCKQLEKKYSKVKLFIHSGNKNRGAGASRNLGIEKSKYPFIAFLDADDYYLPGFFDMAENIFNSYPDADGVFGTISAYYYDELSREKHYKRTGRDKTGLNIDFNPEKYNLLNILLQPLTGHFSIISLVVKKNVFSTTGYFDTELIQGQDTDFIWRLSYFCKLYGLPKDKVIAMRGVHSGNRVLNDEEHKYYGYIVMKKWLKNIKRFNIPTQSARLIFRKYLIQHSLVNKYENITLLRLLIKLVIAIKICFQNPYVFLTLIYKKT